MLYERKVCNVMSRRIMRRRSNTTLLTSLSNSPDELSETR